MLWFVGGYALKGVVNHLVKSLVEELTSNCVTALPVSKQVIKDFFETNKNLICNVRRAKMCNTGVLIIENPFSYVVNYLMRKENARVTFDGYEGDTLGEGEMDIRGERLHVWSTLDLDENGKYNIIEGGDGNATAPGSGPESVQLGFPVSVLMETKNNVRIKANQMQTTLQSLEKKCHDTNVWTMDELKVLIPDIYRFFACKPGGINALGAELNAIKARLVSKTTAYDKIKKDYKLDRDWRPLDSKVYNLMLHHNIDPVCAGNVIANVLSGNFGKRNCLYLFGPASTGKTTLTSCIASAVKIYGMVNHNNKSFPFNDCTGNLLNWWEECTMLEEFVEGAKCLMDGSQVRVDVKHGGSVTVKGTPMIITSNNDITRVQSRGVVTNVHAGPIQSRCTRFWFKNPLSDNYGKLTGEDLSNYLQYCVHKLGGLGLENFCTLYSPSYDLPSPHTCADCTLYPVKQHNYKNRYVECDSCVGWVLKESDDESTSVFAILLNESDHTYSAVDTVRREAQVCEAAGELW